MKRTFLLAVALSSALALHLGAGSANAQLIRRRAEVMQPTQQVSPPIAGDRVAALQDMFVANWIGADNQAEISLNQFASQRASSQDVKDFAQEMIRAHGDLAQKLNQTVTNLNTTAFPRTGQIPYTAGYRGQSETAPAIPGAPAPAANPSQGAAAPALTQPSPSAPAGAVAPVPTPERQAGNPLPAGNSPNTTGSPLGAQPGAATTNPAGPMTSMAAQSQLNPVSLKREINGQLVSLIEQKLGQKQGQEFDRCFMQGQIAAHLHMLATLETVKNQASPQLKPVIDEAVQITQKHLGHAETLLSKLEPHESH